MVGRDWSGTAGDADGGTSAGRRRAACERRRRARPTRGAAHGPAYSAHEIRAQVLGTGWVCVVSVARKARFCRYAATGWPLHLLPAVPAGLAAVSHDPPKEYPQFEYCPSPSRTAHPVHRCRFIHATGGVCAQSSAPGSKQRPAELQVAAAAEFRRVIVDYLDRNVVEPQTILIEPPDGSANRSDRPVNGTVCR